MVKSNHKKYKDNEEKIYEALRILRDHKLRPEEKNIKVYEVLRK